MSVNPNALTVVDMRAKCKLGQSHQQCRYLTLDKQADLFVCGYVDEARRTAIDIAASTLVAKGLECVDPTDPYASTTLPS